eukprot:TRINITY_DN1204_c0_g2_i4.p1 TRINITY_DN1204_c0_g2~~TRINITY_DN1204_c0_g2_i4.p1  ORF type:complete len:182 (+),score=12.58 TRINITY_DN1204_c0_g2_i4:137-682(+)
MQPRLRRGLGVLVILTLLWRSQRRKWGFAAILSGAFFWICQWYYKRIKSNPENYFRLPSSVNVQIVNSEDQIDTMLKPLLKDIKESQFPVIGFDTEWKPRSGSYVSPLALVQLSSEKECILIRVCNMKCFTPALKVLMEDSRYHPSYRACLFSVTQLLTISDLITLINLPTRYHWSIQSIS